MHRRYLVENRYRQGARAPDALIRWSMVSLPVVALLALAGTATAADTNNPDTLSVDSIRETVRAFQVRPALVPRDGEPEVSNAAGSPSIAQAMNVKPPRGAS